MPYVHAINTAKHLFKRKHARGEKIAPRHHHDGYGPDVESEGSIAISDGVGKCKPANTDGDDRHDRPYLGGIELRDVRHSWLRETPVRALADKHLGDCLCSFDNA